jgi:sugar/nucleoside kinase (ribokinase family)
MLCAFGDLVEDVVVRLTAPPERGTDTAAVVTRRRGGSAANVAAFAAGLEGRARHVAQQGADATGDGLVAGLRADGVEVVGSRGGRTGTIVVLVDADGERTFLSDRGCAADLDVCDPSWLDGVTVVHLPAYGLVGGAVAGTAGAFVAAARALDRAIAVSIAASSVAVLRDFGPERFLELLGALQPDVLLANESEAHLLGLTSAGEAVTTPAGVGVAVVKRGRRSTLVGTASVTVEAPVDDLGPVPDTTAAGDAFAAGFLLSHVSGHDVREAAMAGNGLAHQHLRQLRAEAGEPNRQTQRPLGRSPKARPEVTP